MAGAYSLVAGQVRRGGWLSADVHSAAQEPSRHAARPSYRRYTSQLLGERVQQRHRAVQEV